jgi:pimeloyl-ACP methyl ester carboxylesterase
VMNIEKFKFVAHSWGAYLAISYALKYPQRLEHLALVDPWGLDSHQDMSNFQWWKVVIAYTVRFFEGCFSPLRILGPFGPSLVRYFRPDLMYKFSSIVDPSVMLEYIFNSNSNSRPTGKNY